MTPERLGVVLAWSDPSLRLPYDRERVSKFSKDGWFSARSALTRNDSCPRRIRCLTIHLTREKDGWRRYLFPKQCAQGNPFTWTGRLEGVDGSGGP